MAPYSGSDQLVDAIQPLMLAGDGRSSISLATYARKFSRDLSLSRAVRNLQLAHAGTHFARSRVRRSSMIPLRCL